MADDPYLLFQITLLRLRSVYFRLVDVYLYIASNVPFLFFYQLILCLLPAFSFFPRLPSLSAIRIHSRC
jgi:hypothetical protein